MRFFHTGLLACALLGTAAGAEALTPELTARIQNEQAEALKKVDRAHGGKKPSEMSPDERRAVIREQSEATSGVLAKHGVSEKDFARYSATLSKDSKARVDLERARLDKPETEEPAGIQIEEKKEPEEPAPVRKKAKKRRR